jgi:hypothetical protein
VSEKQKAGIKINMMIDTMLLIFIFSRSFEADFKIRIQLILNPIAIIFIERGAATVNGPDDQQPVAVCSIRIVHQRCAIPQSSGPFMQERSDCMNTKICGLCRVAGDCCQPQAP